MANLRGSIGPNGYTPPANVTVTWRRPGAPDIQKPLNRSIRWADDKSFRWRYGDNDPETIGRQITAIGSEQLGGRAYLILKELYAQAGIDRIPQSISQEVWDFAITEIGDRPADWCDYKRMTGKPDPICGDKCPPCSGNGKERVEPGQVVVAPTNLKLDHNRTLSWDWKGEGAVTFTAYTGGHGQPFATLGSTKRSPLVLSSRPADGTLILLYATQRKKQAAEASLVVGQGQVIAPPVKPDPEPNPVEPPDPAKPPIDPPPPTGTLTISGEFVFNINGIEKRYKLVEI